MSWERRRVKVKDSAGLSSAFLVQIHFENKMNTKDVNAQDVVNTLRIHLN